MKRPVEKFSRRSLILSGGALLLSGCDQLSQSPTMRRVLFSAEGLTEYVQRLLLTPDALAREYPESAISPNFRANGSTNPRDPAYQAMARNGFFDWRLKVEGLVERPASFSLSELRALPRRTQITRHDCVEGWSCIGKWTGVPLSELLNRTVLKREARFIAFHCADRLDPRSGPYYESIDLLDAYHPQTILAYEMNGQPLPVPYGAPLRVRLERQLGYKMAKYLMRIEAVATLSELGRGNGGYWEDRGYEWYAGI